MNKEKSKKMLWAGLNCPEEPVDAIDVVVLGAPYDGGVSFRAGAKDGPDGLREISYTIPPTTERFDDLSSMKILDLGNVQGKNRNELFQNLEDEVYNLILKRKFFTVIGGDHSITIPIHRGINRAVNKDFGIIHIDAHCDLCDEMDGDFLSHGSVERRALELNHLKSCEDIFFIGIRSVEMDELDFMKRNQVNVINAVDFCKMGVEEVIGEVLRKMGHLDQIYLTIDIDGLDPAYAAGTGTPQFGGLTSRQMLNLLEGLFQLPIIGFDIVEVAPGLDPSLTSVFAARKILMECWGHHYKKTQKSAANPK
jgi:agmatinase